MLVAGDSEVPVLRVVILTHAAYLTHRKQKAN